MKTNLIKKIGASMIPVLVLSLLLLSPQLLSNVDNNETFVVAQDTTLQSTPTIIVGKVVDLDHQPLEGVVVRDINTTKEKLTNGEGKFELSLDTATVISFTKLGFYNVEHRVDKSDSSLVIILTRQSNELIVKGYDSPTVMGGETEMFEMDTTSTLKQKYDLMKDSIDRKSMKMEATHMKKDNHMHHMDMNMNDSLKDMKKDMWNKDMKHDMDSTKTLMQLHHDNDSIKKMKSSVVEKQ